MKMNQLQDFDLSHSVSACRFLFFFYVFFSRCCGLCAYKWIELCLCFFVLVQVHAEHPQDALTNSGPGTARLSNLLKFGNSFLCIYNVPSVN